MIRSALVSEVQQRALDNGVSSVTTSAQYNTWVDLADRALWNAYAWPFKQKETRSLSTTSGQKNLVLPADVQEIKKVINTQVLGVLQPRNERWCQNIFPDDTSLAPPLFYCDGGLQETSNLTSPPVRVLHLYPVPDAVYALYFRYLALPTLRSAQSVPDSAYSCLPEDFDEALIQWILRHQMLKVGDVAAANLAQQSYTAELQRLIALYSSLTETFPMIDSELDSIYPGSYGVGWGGVS